MDEHKDAIAAWYDEYSVSIFRYIYKIIQNAHVAEDLTQDTFMKAYDFLSKNSANVNYPKTFLYRTGHNLTIDYLRKQKPLQYLITQYINQTSCKLNIEDIVEIKAESKSIYEELAKLKLPYRQVLILRKVERFSTRETAEILNWTESKVKSTLQRALLKLEENLIKGGIINEPISQQSR